MCIFFFSSWTPPCLAISWGTCLLILLICWFLRKLLLLTEKKLIITPFVQFTFLVFDCLYLLYNCIYVIQENCCPYRKTWFWFCPFALFATFILVVGTGSCWLSPFAPFVNFFCSHWYWILFWLYLAACHWLLVGLTSSLHCMQT